MAHHRSFVSPGNQRSCRMFQRALKANKSNKPMQHKLDEFLLVYCLSPRATTDQSSSQLMFGRNVQTKLDLFKPDVRRTVNRKLFSDDKNKPYRCFDKGQQVLVRNYRPGWKWVQREIAVQTGPVSYRVCANETVWRQHADQLLPGPRSSHDPRFEAEAEYEKLPVLHLQRTQSAALQMTHRMK